MSFTGTSKANTGIGPASAPSPAPSTASNGAIKRKRPETPSAGTTFSQPVQTGMGSTFYTQTHYAVEYMSKPENQLKKFTFQELLDYLSVKNAPEHSRRLYSIFKAHEQIRYEPEAAGRKETFSYKPKYDIRSPDELKGFLQRQKYSTGLAVKDLKDGWPDCADAIEALEREGVILVTRNRKDGAPKTVWENDPSLRQHIDPEFRAAWHQIALPANPDELRAKLEAAGLKPTSAPREVAKKMDAKPKKKKVSRRGGRQTNTHMLGILKNYDHKRK